MATVFKELAEENQQRLDKDHVFAFSVLTT